VSGLGCRERPYSDTRHPTPCTLPRVAEEPEGFRDRISRQSEEALGKLAEELLGNPMVASALQRAFEAREKAAHAQEAAMGALGIPSAADVERVTRRLRSVSQRLEAIEDLLDRLEERFGNLDSRLEDAGRSESVERKLDGIARDLVALREAVTPTAEPVPRAQERLTVSEP
jgi:CRP-like cAMP-binding protein